MDLPLVFAMLLGGCPCPDPPAPQTVSDSRYAGYTQAELDELFRDPTGGYGYGPTADTTDTAVPPVDPASLRCEELCAAEPQRSEPPYTTGYGSGTTTSSSSCGLTAPRDDDVAAAICSFSTTYTEEPTCTAGGRLHAAVASRAPTAGTGDASLRWLARMAHDEAASVVAFRRLADELAPHGLPRRLRARIVAAADDEVRHATLVRACLDAVGHPVPSVHTRPVPERSLAELAVENVVEAVVLETWAALRTAYQAAHAAPALRPLFAAVAADEARHAALALDLDAWFRQQPGVDPRALDRARDHAVERLLADRASLPTDAARTLGWPTPPARRHLLEGLRQRVWCRTSAQEPRQGTRMGARAS